MAKKKTSSVESHSRSIASIVRKMQAEPGEPGREHHRRGELLNIMRELGFANYLNDVSQGKRRPDIRYYSESVKRPTNQTLAPFVVETKDIGEAEDIESLPFRQLSTYVLKNQSRLVSIAVTDFEWWYRFEFDANHQAYFSLLNFVRAAAEDEKAWKSLGGDVTARKLFEPFLVGAPFRFSDFLKKDTKGFWNSVRRQFDVSVLNRQAPSFDSLPLQVPLDVDSVAKQLGNLMYPIVQHATAMMLEQSHEMPKAKSRFRLWIKQQGEGNVSYERLVSDDKNLEEQEAFEEKATSFAWMSSYSLLNLLYFIRGLEERNLIAPIINSEAVRRTPSSFFTVLWHESASNALKLYSDFIGLQKVYCDWLIPRVPQGVLGELVRFVASTSGFSTSQPDLLGHLYEQLMQNLDAGSRRKLGQYYTPKPIAELLWKLARTSLHASGIQAEEVTTLDPACGSGMLLCRGADLLMSEMKPAPKALGATVRDLATRNISGFEINPLSSAIARINLFFTYIDQVSKRNADPLSVFVKKVSISELPIFNTDAYKITEEISNELDKLAELEGEDINALKRETALLKHTKDRADFILLIGNPPYCGSDEAVLEGRANHLQVWKDQVTKRKPNGGIREAYIHFLGLAHTILTKGGRGMLAFVTSDTWLNNFDHEIARRFFLKHYETQGIVFMGAGMFPGLKVSTCLVLMKLREQPLSDEEIESTAVPIYSLSVAQQAATRYEEIDAILKGKKEIKWKHVLPDEHACVRDVNVNDIDTRTGFNNITALFKQDFQTCKTGADPFVTAPSLAALRSRMLKIIGGNEYVEPDSEISGKNNKDKLAKLRMIRDRDNVTYKPKVCRPFLKFSGSKDLFGVPRERQHHVYFEPDLLDRPAVATKKVSKTKTLTWVPHEASLKLAFNSHELPMRAFVVETAAYVHRWQHLRFCPSTAPSWAVDKDSVSENVVTNFSELGQSQVKTIGSEVTLMYFISGWVNSAVMQIGFASKAETQEAPIPDLSKMSKSVLKQAVCVARIAKILTKIEAESTESEKTIDVVSKRVLRTYCKELNAQATAEDCYEAGLKEINRLCQQISESIESAAKAA